MSANKKTEEERAVDALDRLARNGWKKLVLAAVRPDGKVVCLHHEMAPIEIVGLLEVTKMTVVRGYVEREETPHRFASAPETPVSTDSPPSPATKI